jgi:tetratricopeptide (TPR) repeat protein
VGEAIEAEAGADVDEVAELLSLHFFYAQRFEEAWRFSRRAAEKAAQIFANVEARDFFVRALEAAGRLSGLARSEVAAVGEALGDVRMRLGEYREAERAYRDARRHVDGDVVAQARLLLKEALVLDVEGRYPQALRTLTRGTRLLADGDPGVVGLRAQLAAHYAGIRKAQGHDDEAVTWSRRALADGEAANELDATAHALYVLDRAEHTLGLSRGGEHSLRALDLYEELGNLSKQGDVLNNLGLYAYFQGDWSEALSYYEQARDLFLRTGNIVDAAIDEGNIGDVLMFQGHLEEAEERFADALRIFKASGVRPQEVFAVAELAATASRAGRFDEAVVMFDEAEALVRELGDEYAADVAGLRAECLVLQGRPDEAAPLIDGLLSTLPTNHPFVPWLLRNRGYASAQNGDRAGAQRSLRESLRSARSLGADHDVAFALEAFVRCGLSDGRSVDEMQRERDELNDRLGIVAVPHVPLPERC